MSDDQIIINNLSKTYDNGFNALKNINLNIKKGEILAMLGPNGAGKTTLISIICGIVKSTSGKITVDDFDTIKNYRETRSRIGMVPQELNLESFETVFDNVSYTRGLYGKPPKPEHIEKILKDLSLWDKKDQRLRQLSGGMKRRVLIAKALSHEPKILFLDEPTAGVDVELRRDMWMVVDDLRKTGVTIILTTHYIEEAEAIADRVAVINQGEIIVVEDKKELIKKMGHKKLSIELQKKITEIPKDLLKYNLEIGDEHMSLIYTYNVQAEKTGITDLLQDLKDTGLKLRDLKTEQSTLEKIFVNLVKENNEI
jgi:ABC-2 type transport system ATP-binding protein